MSYVVKIQPSGKTFEVESGVSILSTALKRGINLPYGCRMGTCCTCRGRVTEGKVDLGHAHHSYLPQSQRDEGYALLCQASALSDITIEVDELPPLAPAVEFPAMVRSIEMLASDVARVVLRVPLHLNLRFTAGQFVDLILGDGVRRSYSIASAPRLEGMVDFEFHIRHTPGGLFTDRVFGDLKTREKFNCEGPLGTFFLRQSDKPAIMLASGTGYAPIRSILLDTLPKNGDREFVLYWGARVRQDLYLNDEVEALAREYPNFRYIPVLSDATVADNWTGRTGFVHRAVMVDYPDMSEVQVYACGVPIMVDSARADFAERCSLPLSEFFADSFVTSAEANVGTTESP
ncbi:2Fe-2S iron-sulfur cluster-binding protein [Sphingobium sp.]|uniref:2Fe-2S iron-sulfur cluster-binding protein n=1 Tax=Sphingobium sp. TaxID=1912891 RepID=UPI0028BDD1AE|nr:2Fe-2S iron-sulfur cluster-binding protein [Sphingobium sp.]